MNTYILDTYNYYTLAEAMKHLIICLYVKILINDFLDSY